MDNSLVIGLVTGGKFGRVEIKIGLANNLIWRSRPDQAHLFQILEQEPPMRIFCINGIRQIIDQRVQKIALIFQSIIRLYEHCIPDIALEKFFSPNQKHVPTEFHLDILPAFCVYWQTLTVNIPFCI